MFTYEKDKSNEYNDKWFCFSNGMVLMYLKIIIINNVNSAELWL